MTALDGGLFQNDGIVWIAFQSDDREVENLESYQLDQNLLRELVDCVQSLPLPVVAFHACSIISDKTKTPQVTSTEETPRRDTADFLSSSVATAYGIEPTLHCGKTPCP